VTPHEAPGREAEPSWNFGRFSRRSAWLQKFTIARLARSFGTYQPVTLDGAVLAEGDRGCAARWQLMESAFARFDVASVLDLGCAEGYFTRRAAAKNCVALGVDGDIRRVTIAQSVAFYEGASGVGFLHARIDPAFVAKLPRFDLVIFLSVLHHVIGEQGMDAAHRLMQAVRSRTVKTLIFDMGQSNETQFAWARTLPAMEPDPAAWIADFLRRCGFSSVQMLGESEGYQRLHSRALFMAAP
jgi:SAM-dependent methyltransferase